MKPTTSPAQPGGDVVPPVLLAVKAFAAQKYGVSPDDVKILKMEPVEWRDSCLGAGQANEICAMVITPGYKFQVDVKGTTYTLHTDAGGSSIRVSPVSPSATGSDPVVESARRWLADRLKVDFNKIQLVSVTPQQWPDGCLGIRRPNIACTDMIVPGFRVILQLAGTNYEIRTDQNARTIDMAEPGVAPTPKSAGVSDPVLGWTSGGNPCSSLQIAGKQAAYGPCGSVPNVTLLPNPQRVNELNDLVKRYAAFTAQTPAGEIILAGSGPTQATALQQRAVAEWAQMVYLEVSSTAAIPNVGLALSWHREGGIAGFCDDLKIYRSGLAVAASCKGNQQRPAGIVWLTDAQLSPFFTWLDQLQTSDGKITDGAVADSMTVTWMLNGSGKRAPTEVERQQITGLAGQIFATAK
jgi:hypothetical protein